MSARAPFAALAVVKVSESPRVVALPFFEAETGAATTSVAPGTVSLREAMVATRAEERTGVVLSPFLPLLAASPSAAVAVSVCSPVKVKLRRVGRRLGGTESGVAFVFAVALLPFFLEPVVAGVETPLAVEERTGRAVDVGADGVCTAVWLSPRVAERVARVEEAGVDAVTSSRTAERSLRGAGSGVSSMFVGRRVCPGSVSKMML